MLFKDTEKHKDLKKKVLEPVEQLLDSWVQLLMFLLF